MFLPNGNAQHFALQLGQHSSAGLVAACCSAHVMSKTEGGHQHKQSSRDFSVCYVGSWVKTCFNRDWATQNNVNETRETPSVFVSPEGVLNNKASPPLQVHPHSFIRGISAPPWFYDSLRSPSIELIWAPFLAPFTALISHSSLAPIMRPSAARHITICPASSVAAHRALFLVAREECELKCVRSQTFGWC